MSTRQADPFDQYLTTERAKLKAYLVAKQNLPDVRILPGPKTDNPISDVRLGAHRSPEARKLATGDTEILESFQQAGLAWPTFREAGPRKNLHFDPHSVRAAIVTAGGLAPGLNSIVHSLVSRHVHTYGFSSNTSGGIFGIVNSFWGAQHVDYCLKPLRPEETEEWLDHGGSELGNVRTQKKEEDGQSELASKIVPELRAANIDILYVIGGDGSQKVAHKIANAEGAEHISVVGLPKTMDNDLLWVWQSFGFNTAVERATDVINTLHTEARGARRVSIVELFGAESGYVAANATLASGRPKLALIPEVFREIADAADAKSDPGLYERALDRYIDHLKRAVWQDPLRPHGVVVLAEGVGSILKGRRVVLWGDQSSDKPFAEILRDHLKKALPKAFEQPMEVVVNPPRHYIRAAKANAHDQIYCERLGALAVDNALAGYTDCMISQWLTEYVLIPLEMVTAGRKSIPTGGIFWKQVCSMTGQPTDPLEGLP